MAVTAGVVTPNMVSPRAGFDAVTSAGRLAMAVIAWAALCRMTRLSRFRPAMSVTEGIITMSETST